MTIDELVEQAHTNSRLHGFWDNIEYHNVYHQLALFALITSEIGEAIEEIRKRDFSKEALSTELADIVIRCCDVAGGLGIDLEQVIVEKMSANKIRPYKHGKRA